jgi:hypothetical protein
MKTPHGGPGVGAHQRGCTDVAAKSACFCRPRRAALIFIAQLWDGLAHPMHFSIVSEFPAAFKARRGHISYIFLQPN